MTTQEFSYSVNNEMDNLKKFAYKFTDDYQDANDLIQDTVFKAISNKHRFRIGTNLRAWLYTIMKNSFITKYQKMKRHRTFIDPTHNLYYINDSNHTTDNYGETSFVLRDIKKAINKLDDTYKTPFMMYFRGFKYKEIADKLDVPIGTVKNRIHIARKELKDKLEVYA